MNGNITREGISKDIREMRRVGLGGAQIFNVDDGIPAGPVAYMSPEWLDLVRHAVREADKAGLKLCLHNCAGWSSSGGPWVPPEQAMQKLVWTEARVQGGRTVNLPLPQPPAVRGMYRDIAVLAFPTPPAEMVRFTSLDPTVTCSGEGRDGKRLIDGDGTTWITLPGPRPDRSCWVQIELAKPMTARSVFLQAGPGRNGARGKLLVSNDGKDFRPVTSFAFPGGGQGASRASSSFEPVRARYFRLECTHIDSRAHLLVLAEVAIRGGTRLQGWPAKAGFSRADGLIPSADMKEDPDAFLALNSIVDLSKAMDKTGRLTWAAPAGDWTIMRFGHTCTGKDNHPAPPSGRGLEVDKLDKDAVQAFWDHGVAPILDYVGPLVGKTLNNILIDSYEVGCQTWTRRLPEQFHRLRGYDPVRYLPACTGRIIGSRGLSERFLWDVRRTLADLFAEAYFGHFAEMAHRRGMKLSVEAYGNGNFDNMEAGARADIPMTEFWCGSLGSPGGAKQASSIAHTYGRTIVGAESFTASPENGAWRNHPWAVKALGDRMWAYGVNRFIFHRYAHQPWTDVRPGMTMSRWGMHFEWPITWWEQARAWTLYLARSQFLLQRGHFVGDLLYFQGEGAPASLPYGRGLRPPPPRGYDYDGCDVEVVLHRLNVKHGRLVLANGAEYALLVLPPHEVMTPRVARRIRELVQAGATVVGPRPRRAPGLTDYPRCDQEVARIGEEVWGPCDGKTVRRHAFGKGSVVWGMPLEDVLAEKNVPPDATFTSGDEEVALEWLHRRDGDTDIYFVASAARHYLRVTGTFRVIGRQARLWHPDTGAMETAPVTKALPGATRVTFPMDPCGSLFVVFRGKPLPGPSITAIRRDGPARVSHRPKDELIIDKAVYGVPESSQDRVDLTAKVQALLERGIRTVPASNGFAGRDPVPGVVKELRVDFVLDGKEKTVVVSENDSVSVPEGARVKRVLYGMTDDRPPVSSVDVTRQLRQRVKDGRLVVPANNEIAGDPAPQVVKELRVNYHVNGEPGMRVVRENQILRIPTGAADYGLPPAWNLHVGSKASFLDAWVDGTYIMDFANGKESRVRVENVSAPQPLTIPWTVKFPPNLGAPPQVTFDKLVSWTRRPEPGVRAFSGTAEYRGRFHVDAEMLGPDRRVMLDLGQVLVFAELTVNGHAYGVLWKPPFREDVTEALKPGENTVQVRVTNLWPNRLIADAGKDTEEQWGADGRLLAWPEWIKEGKPKPDDGRITWTTWRHYTPASLPMPSGLLGPVVLIGGRRIPLP